MEIIKSDMSDRKLLSDMGVDSTSNYDDVYMLYKDNTRIGCIEYRIVDEDVCYVEYIYILKAYRNKGYAKEAINILLDRGYDIQGNSVVESIGFWSSIGAEFEEDLSDDSIDMYIRDNTCVPFSIIA